MDPRDDSGEDLEKKPLYAVVFSGEENASVDKGPFADGPREDVIAPHGFDQDIVAALPGLWYCLHLPNTVLQLGDLPASVIKKCQPLDFPHEIVLCPVQLFGPEWITRSPIEIPTLVLCPDELWTEVAPRAEAMGFKLGTTPYSKLSHTQLRKHWREIHRELAPSRPYLGREPRLTERLDLAPTYLPLRFLERQLAGKKGSTSTDLDELIQETLWQQTVLAAVAELQKQEVEPTRARDRMPSEIQHQGRALRIPVAIALPGIPNRYARSAHPDFNPSKHVRIEQIDPSDRWTPDFSSRSNDQIERAVLEFVTSHRAIAKTGVGLMLSELPQQAFHALAQLEEHCRGRPNPKVVWRLLQRISDNCQEIFTEEFEAVASRASSLTAFTNFPIGLLQPAKDQDPLSCHFPIAYRPVLPLTRALQQELQSAPAIDFSDGFRVLIAECIPRADPVGRLSRVGWDFATSNLLHNEAVTIKHVDTESAAALRSQIADEKPHILVLSAHGVYLRNANTAGLKIGNQLCLGPELGRQPPVVLLSACAVGPRGVGEVTIADLLIREGASAVLGAQIPIDVRRNATLMVRFFTYILESQARREPEVTILDIWHRASTTNAVNDILRGNRHLEEWGHRSRTTALPVIQEFMLVRSSGRLRRGSVYADTESVLGEMADEEGCGEQVRNWFRNPGYVPESLFYMFIGRPDQIRLREPIDLSTESWKAIRARRQHVNGVQDKRQENDP